MRLSLLVGSLVAVAALSGCQSMHGDRVGQTTDQPVLKSTLMTTDGSNAEVGEMFLRPVANGVQIFGGVTNLHPGETVALHIHETGNCSNMGKAAGGHFNPTNNPHGHPNSTASHAGDLPNLTANAQGVASINYLNTDISIDPNAANGVYNRAFIVHAGADDYTSQPSGDAGSRIACGVIERY